MSQQIDEIRKRRQTLKFFSPQTYEQDVDVLLERVEKLEKGLKAVIEISKTDGNRMLDNCYIVANQALKD